MGVQVSSSRFQWPSVVSGATTRKGPGMPSSWRWNSSVASDCAVLPRPCAPRVCCSKTLAYPGRVAQQLALEVQRRQRLRGLAQALRAPGGAAVDPTLAHPQQGGTWLKHLARSGGDMLLGKEAGMGGACQQLQACTAALGTQRLRRTEYQRAHHLVAEDAIAPEAPVLHHPLQAGRLSPSGRAPVGSERL